MSVLPSERVWKCGWGHGEVGGVMTVCEVCWGGRGCSGA